MILISSFVILIFAVLVQCDELIVNTNYGKVKGEQLTTLLGKKPYFSFKGIPYAEPPVGNFRFKPAEKSKPWSTVRNATRFGNVCVQRDFFDPTNFFGDEDCLFVNVYTPDLNPKEKLPVVFGVHAGAFFYGNGGLMRPDFLIDQNVIFVTINYRLGALGFLSLGTPEYSGNMGLKDQNLALKWTNENIHHFGGNKDSITIIGDSAGGASIHYHMLSPLSKGLFKRAVVMCGSALNPWAYDYHRDHIQILKDLGVRVNNPLDDKDDIIDFLKQVDATFLTRHTFQEFLQFGLPKQNIAMIWSPRVEHPDTKNPFLLDSPETILRGNYVSNVDAMFTYASNEMLMASPLVSDEMTAKLNSQLEIHLPLAEANIDYKSEAYQEIATKIRKYYFNDDGTVSGSDKGKYIKLLSDIYFAYGVHKAAQLQASKSTGKTYNWIYSGTPSVGGSHTDDSSHIFLRNSDWILKSVYEDFNEEVVNVINTLSSFVAEFARSGNPTPNQRPVDFKPITSDARYFLNITRTELMLSVDPMSKDFAFWDDIFETYFGEAPTTAHTNYRIKY